MSLLGHLWRWVARGGDTLAGPVGAGFLWDTYGGPWGTPMVSLAISQPLPMAWEKTPGYHFCDNQSDNQGHPP